MRGRPAGMRVGSARRTHLCRVAPDAAIQPKQRRREDLLAPIGFPTGPRGIRHLRQGVMQGPAQLHPCATQRSCRRGRNTQGKVEPRQFASVASSDSGSRTIAASASPGLCANLNCSSPTEVVSSTCPISCQIQRASAAMPSGTAGERCLPSHGLRARVEDRRARDVSQRRTLRNRTFEIIRKAFYTDAGVDSLAIFSGSGSDSRAIVNPEWKGGDPEIGVWRQSVCVKAVEELLDVPVRHHRGGIV